MSRRPAQTGPGAMVLVAIEQGFAEGERILADELAGPILPLSSRLWVWLLRPVCGRFPMEVHMFERVLLGVGRRMIPVPELVFRPKVQRDAAKLARRPGLEPDQRRVQHFAVREIPRRREAIAPEVFAAELGLPLEEVLQILDELERRMTFLCRRGGEDVSWAYPVTSDETPHQVRIDGGAAFSAA